MKKTANFSKVVDENSAKIGLHEEYEKSLQLNLSHCNLCKFQSESDVDFRVVSKNIEWFVQAAVRRSSGVVMGGNGYGNTGVLAYQSNSCT